MSIKKLAGQTAIYGVSSLLGRLLYFFLTPLYTRVFDLEDYGVMTDIFSFVGLSMIFFTYRFETAYFRFATDKIPGQAKKSYDTSLISILMTSLLLGTVIFFGRETLAEWFRYPEYAYILGITAGILVFDSLAEIPLSHLRLAGKPIKFAFVRLTGILINISVNLFFLLLCPYLESKGIAPTLTGWIYNPAIGIGYIFIANLIASIVVWILLSPYYLNTKLSFDWSLWRKQMAYALPLIIVSISFSINELLDRKIMIWLLPGSDEENKAVLGGYGAAYKLTMILALFTQAFRYGAEPFFFQQKTEKNATVTYANVTKYYALFAITGSLFTLLYLDVIKFLVPQHYWIALGVIPILLLANLANGLYYNLSVWYRLIDKTMYGAWIAMAGALTTILLNLWWLPLIGYWGAALATLVCYSLMLTLCYYTGQKYYPVKYDLKSFFQYLVMASALYAVTMVFPLLMELTYWWGLFFNTVILMVFIAYIYKKEKSVLQPIIATLLVKVGIK